MRILRLIISAFLFFVVIIVAGFFILRELMLLWGTSKIKSSLREMSLSQNRGSFATQCYELGAKAPAGESLVTYQLRFISSTEYIVEAVCEGLEFDPILIAQKTLPQFVTKVPGTSGFTLSSEQTAIELEVFRKEIDDISQKTGFDLSFLDRKKLLVSQSGVLIKSSDTTILSANGPITACDGYGYECCDEISHFGVGDKITGLADCKDSCYSSCASRPVVLSFNTSPVMDRANRSVSVRSGNTVEFTFVADSGDSKSMSGVISFGDGDKAQISGLAGQESHTYSCALTRCEYTAKIVLEDNWGIKSADLMTNKVKVIVIK